MMSKKKIIGLTLFTAAIILAAGCGKNDTADTKTPDIKTQEINTQEITPLDIVTANEATGVQKIPEPNGIKNEEVSSDIDIDLTQLSSTMVYSEVFNMMYYPEEYVGKTVKMNGMYVQYHDEVTDKYYHNCLIMDATACCSQGIEFELTDDYSFPNDYPSEGQPICVAGTFDTYNEGEDFYCTLRQATLVN